MKIAIGSDHRGFRMKNDLKAVLEKAGHRVEDVGTHAEEPPCDYPDIAKSVSAAVAAGRAERGILACKSGIGMAIAANKTRGIRAALCCNLNSVRLSRQHNDANVLVLSADDLTDPIETVVREWLSTSFEGGRHQKRVDIIARIEKENFK